MPRTSILNLRIEPEVKAEAEELFSSFGLTVTDAVNVFLRQSLMRGGFPFEVVRCKPNAATQAAMAEADRLMNDPSAKSFKNMDELKADLALDGNNG
jgi:DNA-damage-inducible protein J